MTRKTWDVIVAGAGIIGLSLALALRKRGMSVLVVERGAPGREASHAAAGMLAWCEPHVHPALHALAVKSYQLYPEFVHEVEDESQHRVDFRREGTIELLRMGEPWPTLDCIRPLQARDIAELEPRIKGGFRGVQLAEASVDPPALCDALLAAAKHREIDLATGFAVTELIQEDGRVAGVRTERTDYHAPIVVNCCGAWASGIAGVRVPTRPVKGHMLALVGAQPLRHVIRLPKTVYLVPRSDGRLVIGSTVEESGYDKRVVPETIKKLHQLAANLVPEIGDMRIHDVWTGLRPATLDEMPILGATIIPGYFAATGHFRDGILLAPATAHVMSQLIAGEKPNLDLLPFSPDRFAR